MAVLLVSMLASPTADAAPPSNDNFTDALEISSLPFSLEISTTEATTEFGEPDPSCVSVGGTVWFRFTADRDMMLSLDTFDSTFDSALALWRGTSLHELQEVDCNDRYKASDGGSIYTGIHTGETVYIQAGGYSFYRATWQTGRLVLKASRGRDEGVRFRPPVNDARATATPIDTLPFEDYQQIDAASRDTEDPPCPEGPLRSEPSVWYAFTSTGETPVVLTAAGQDQYINIGVYERRGDGLIPVLCTPTGSWRASAVLAPRSSATYAIQIVASHVEIDGFSYGTRLVVAHAEHVDAAVLDLQVSEVFYETDVGQVEDPRARDILFTVGTTDRRYWYGAWRIDACPQAEGVSAGRCSTVAQGLTESDRLVRRRWNAVGAGRVTVVVSLSTDATFDPDPSNDTARHTFTIGPASGVGVLIA